MRRLLRRRWSDRLRQVLAWAGVAVLIAVIVSAASQLLVGRPLGLVPISGNAMAPTIRSGGMVVCLAYLWTEPAVGDIILFRPRTADLDLCRRVVAASGGGWVTQADSSDLPDEPPVTRAEIHGFVPQIGRWPLWLPGIGSIGARPGSRSRLVVALAAALILVAVPPARIAGKRLGRRRRRANVASRTWVYILAALICTGLAAGATAWVGGQAAISLESEESAMARSSATGPVDITVAPATGQVVVTNGSPVALLVLAYAEPRGDSMVDRRFALVPAHGSQAFGLTQGLGRPDSGIELAYAPALVPADWLYPMVREWGPTWGFVALAALQFGIAAALLCGADLALARFRS